MHIVLVSNCQHRALNRTRSLLDRYAIRAGDRVWLTLITQEALEEIHLALRKQATRQTSVACYRNDATVGLRLIWIVGNKSGYDAEGRYAIATKTEPKGLPMYFGHAALVARFAGYCHDLGKASVHFQEKLKQSTKKPQKPQVDEVRHEWLSAWLVKQMLSATTLSAKGLCAAWDVMGDKNTGPVVSVPIPQVIESGLDAALWAIGTHHGAVGGKIEGRVDKGKHVRSTSPTTGEWSKRSDIENPQNSPQWDALFEDIGKTRARLDKIERSPRYWEGVMLAARAALILADHKVSSGIYPGDAPPAKTLFANTKKRGKTITGRKLDQPLVWHLKTIGDQASDNLRMFAGDDLPSVDTDLVRLILEDRASGRFEWQNTAVDAAGVMSDEGGLIFNVASTGAGKTLANLKIAAALRPDGLRLAVAFNLRSLTAQTYTAFGRHIERIGGDKHFERDFAYLVGEKGGAETPDFRLDDGTSNEQTDDEQKDGTSKSDEEDVTQEWAEEDEVGGGRNLVVPEWLKTSIAKGGDYEKQVKLIASPVLISTADWICAAGEPGEQARHAKAVIRVINSDLILDEVDSYDVKAAVALMRVVQTAASFGRNVIVSSATLNPELANGLARAYAAGRRVFEAMTGKNGWHLMVTSDLFDPVREFAPTPERTDELYRKTMFDMSTQLKNRPVTKRFRVADVNSKEAFWSVVAAQAMDLHEQCATQPEGLACRLSIGLVRVANVNPCMELSDTLAKDGAFIVTAYHARELTQRRAWKEAYLDRILDRTPGSNWMAALKEAVPEIESMSGDVRLIVVATPVEEVGRDHDFDWAIIEPSSMHSIIQTSGRVNRHRMQELDDEAYNVVVLSRNLRGLRGERQCFIKPGLECDADGPRTSHPLHDTNELLKPLDPNCQRGDTLDASLIFGDRKTYFAQFDEDATSMTIKNALKIIDRQPGHETGFMKSVYAKSFRLRDGAARFFYNRKNDEFTLDDGREPAGRTGRFSQKYDALNSLSVWLTPPDISESGDSFIVKNNPVGVNTTVTGRWNGLVFP